MFPSCICKLLRVTLNQLKSEKDCHSQIIFLSCINFVELIKETGIIQCMTPNILILNIYIRINVLFYSYHPDIIDIITYIFEI